MVLLSAIRKPEKSAFWDIAFCLLCVLAICQLGYVGAKHAAKLFFSPVEIRSDDTEFHFNDYVRINTGFYRGFEGWIDEKQTDTFLLKLNDRTLPPRYIVQNMLGGHLRRNACKLSVRAEDIKIVFEPVDPPVGIDQFWKELMRTISAVEELPIGSYVKTDPVEIDGALFAATIATKHVPVKATVVPPDDTPL